MYIRFVLLYLAVQYLSIFVNVIKGNSIAFLLRCADTAALRSYLFTFWEFAYISFILSSGK